MTKLWQEEGAEVSALGQLSPKRTLAHEAGNSAPDLAERQKQVDGEEQGDVTRQRMHRGTG